MSSHLPSRRDALASCRRGIVAILLMAQAGMSHEAAAQSAIDPRLYAGISWRNLGPFRSGRVGAVSGVIGNPGVYYAGFPGGGLWKTTSAGQVWVPIFDAVRATSSIGAVEVAPSDANVVYVGTGDMITGGTLDQGNGMYKSVDAGRTWQSIGLEGTRHIQTLLVDPRRADVVLAGALGDHIHANNQRGVFRTTDGGRTWTQTLYLDDQTGIAKLARAFDVPDVIYATTVRHYTPPGYSVGSFRSWQFGTARMPGDTSATRSTIWKSHDGGVTWTRLAGTGLPALEGRMCASVAIGTNAQRVYLITNHALHRSDDGGATWRQMAVGDERIRNGQGGYSCGVYIDPANPDLVYTINTAAYKSTDGGRSFTGLKGAPGGDDPQQLWIDPTDGRRILMGLDQGAIVTLDGGATWSSWYNQSTEQLYHLAADNSFPYWVYATQQDAGAIRTRVRGNYGAITMFDWNSVNGWEWGSIVADPRDPNTVFASGIGVVKISYPTEQFINVSPAIGPAARARWSNSLPLVWAPWNARQLLAGLNYVVSTTDHGAHWTRLSPELGIAAGMDSVTADKTLGGRGAIESMSASPRGVGEIWVGTNNGLIHLTRDGGKSWRDVSIPGLPARTRANVSSIEPSPHTPGTAYAAVEYLRIGDHAPYIYRTRDYGRTWTKVVAGLPADEVSGSFARVVRPDPVKPGLLFAGTESGIHVSFNDGDSWQSLGLNLPNTPVRDLLVKDNDLVIATHGRGLWVLDDISMLRQVATDIAAAPLHIYTPGRSTRVRRNTNFSTPLPPEIPHADNPLDGVIIDYWLGAAATDGVTIDVLDARGEIVRHLTSAVQPPVPEATRPPFPDFWVDVPAPLPSTPGHHRVHWNVRYDAPPAFTHTFEINSNPFRTPPSPQGPLALPGTYTLRISALGVSSSTRVIVRNDPRSTVAAAGLQAQHGLQRRIMEGMATSYAAQQQVDTLRRSMAAMGTGAPAELVPAMQTLHAAIDAAVGADTARQSAGRFREINEAFASQLNGQETADNAPNAGMRAAHAEVSRRLVGTLERWRRVLGRDLAALNEARTRLGLTPIPVPGR
jgi:photosystem II stability/assembly factor-like uncharacterized protein